MAINSTRIIAMTIALSVILVSVYGLATNTANNGNFLGGNTYEKSTKLSQQEENILGQTDSFSSDANTIEASRSPNQQDQSFGGALQWGKNIWEIIKLLLIPVLPVEMETLITTNFEQIIFTSMRFLNTGLIILSIIMIYDKFKNKKVD